GYAGITSPGNAPSAITVGALNTQGTATRDDDVVAPYSSRGPTWYDAYQKPDVVAPGHKLVADAATKSWLYQQYPGSLVGETGGSHAQFITLSGTSMATAVTSGVVALVIEANRQAVLQTGHAGHLTPNAIKAVLEYTAYVLPNTDVLTQGAGAINPLGA